MCHFFSIYYIYVCVYICMYTYAAHLSPKTHSSEKLRNFSLPSKVVAKILGEFLLPLAALNEFAVLKGPYTHLHMYINCLYRLLPPTCKFVDVWVAYWFVCCQIAVSCHLCRTCHTWVLCCDFVNNIAYFFGYMVHTTVSEQSKREIGVWSFWI